MIKYIGITGVAGSGKDTVARILEERLGSWAKDGDYDWTAEILHLADPLKESVAALLGIPVSVLSDRDVKESIDPLTGLSYRKIMQVFGDVIRGNFGPDFFIKSLDVRASELKYAEYIIVPDVRYPNEADYIRSKGGVLLKVIRPSNPFAIEATHASEASIAHISCHCILDNSQGIGHLENKVNIIAERIANDL